MNWVKLKAGDERVWLDAGRQLFDVALAAVQFQCRNLSLDLARHAANEALRQVILQIDDIRSEEGLHQLLFKVARLRAVDEVRKLTKPTDALARAESLDEVQELGQEKPDPKAKPPSVAVAHAERMSIAADLLNRLPPDDAQLLREAYLMELAHREIARIHGWETNTVGNRINQALKRARKLLSSDERLREICDDENDKI